MANERTERAARMGAAPKQTESAQRGVNASPTVAGIPLVASGPSDATVQAGAVSPANGGSLADVQQRERQMQALCRINRALFTYDTLDETIQRILESAVDVVEGDVGSVQLYDAERDVLVFRYVLDPAAPTLIGYRMPISQGINGRVFRTGVPDISNTVRDKPDWNRNVDDRSGYETQSMLTVPIMRPDGERLGVMQILNGQKRFGKRDLQILELVCSQAAQAISNAHLRSESERLISHLQALRAIDTAITSSLDLRLTLSVFLDQVVGQLKADGATVLLLNEATQQLEHASARGFRSRALMHTHLPLGQGHAGLAALERRVIYIENLETAPTSLKSSPHFAEEGFISYHAVPLIAKGTVNGVLEIFHRRPFSPGGEWREFLETLAGQAAIAIDNARLFDGLQRTNTELTLAYDTTLEGWSRAMDLRDKETEGHTQRVTEKALQLARAMNADWEELIHIRRGALLHDIGKMGIPDLILFKPGPLDDEEWEIMRRHPVYAYELLSPIAFLRSAIDIPYCHHEKWDGSGYPRGLKGEQIPLSARIFAVIDVWDALRSDRPYRPAWEEDRVLQHIREGAGSHFDPQVVEAFEQLAD